MDLEYQRAIVKRKREEFEVEEKALKSLYDAKACEVCPFSIGDVIEYEPGKKGEVQQVYFSGRCWMPLEKQDPVAWTVTGQKIKKDGNYGKKNFNPVSNETHNVNGRNCRIKTFEETLGIE